MWFIIRCDHLNEFIPSVYVLYTKHLNSCYSVSIPLTGFLLSESKDELVKCPVDIINSYLAEKSYVGHGCLEFC